MGNPIISKFSYRFTLAFKSKSWKNDAIKFIKGKFSVAIRESMVNEKDQILLERILLKIIKIITETNEGNKQKPRKVFNE